MNTYIKHKRPQVNLNVLQHYTLTNNRQGIVELLHGCISCDEKKKLKKKETINYTLLFWGQNIFQRARICDRGKIGLIALH